MSISMEYSKLKSQLFDKYFGFLNQRQREAVFTTQGPLLVLAGAGSGKTTVIVNRIANILLFGDAATNDFVPHDAEALVLMMNEALKKGDKTAISEALQKCATNRVFPYRVLCITFTNKAANEFKARLEKALGPQAQDIWAGTFHSICVRILRRHIDNLGYDNSFTIYDTDDSKKLIVSILKELDIDEKTVPPKMAMSLISRAKENQQTASEFALEAGRDNFLVNIAKIYKRYQEQLKSANALDFDDIIMLTNRLFEDFPEVLERYQNQFEYILVDEYQDTNPSQSRLVAHLSGEKKNVCVVGDDDQSIYSFRGATVDNILGFDMEYSGAKVIRLEQNYRSTGNILQAANGIIQNNRSRKGKELWTDVGDGEKVQLKQLYTQSEEANFICETIEKQVIRGAKYSDFAILYRVNALSSSLETALVKNKIPYRIFGGIRFYERREIKDILAYLSLVANPADSVRLRRIINVPKRAIGDSTVEKIASLADENNVSMFTVLSNASEFKELARGATRLESFGAMINDLRDYAKEHSLGEIVSRVIEVTGYRVMLAEEEDGNEREENILELVSAAALFEETAETPTLAEFLNEISLVSDLDNYESGADAVTLMTVHSAKGLEFPTVFIAGFEEGMFPSSQSFNEGERGLEEERRLAYVAVTRAKRELYILHTASRMVYGRTEARQISRFAEEIPPSSCERTGAKQPYNQNRYDDRAQKTNNRNVYLENLRAASTKTQKADFIPMGSTVTHPLFGKGEVLSAEPMGGDVLYEIEFANGSVKRLMGNFAKLKKC